MTASVVKQDPNIKGSKERYLLGQKHNLQIFGVIPYQATKRHLNKERNLQIFGGNSLYQATTF